MTSFADFSKEIVSDFLRTALLIDDKAFIFQPPQEEVSRPVRPGRLASEKETKNGKKTKTTAAEDLAHELDAEAVIRDFAEMDMFCVVLRPESKNDLLTVEGRFRSLGQQADVVVFDWVLFPEGERDGTEALHLIEYFVSQAIQEQRLRLVLIYTGNQYIEEIIDEVFETLKASHPKLSRDGDFSLRLGSIRIAIYAKPDADIPEEAPQFSRKVSSGELPKRVVEEFTAMTAGLVSNAALKSFSILRNNTHRLLEVLHKDFDAPYLAHRLMLKNPADAEEFLETLIADDVASLLRGGEIAETVTIEKIEMWLKEKKDGLDLTPLFQENNEPNPNSILTLLRLGANAKLQEADVYYFPKGLSRSLRP